MSRILEVVKTKFRAEVRLSSTHTQFLTSEGFVHDDVHGTWKYIRRFKGEVIKVYISEFGEVKLTYQYSPKHAVIGKEMRVFEDTFDQDYDKILSEIRRISYGGLYFTYKEGQQ